MEVFTHRRLTFEIQEFRWQDPAMLQIKNFNKISLQITKFWQKKNRKIASNYQYK